MPNIITAATKNYLLSLKPSDLTKEFFDKNCSVHYDKNTKKIIPPMLSFQDRFTLEKGEYVNTEKVETNVGRFLLNKTLFEPIPRLQKFLGYINETFTNGYLGDVENLMSQGKLEGDLESEDMIKYFNIVQWLGNSMNTNTMCSFTAKTAKPIDKVAKRRDELYKQYAEDMKNGNVVKAVEISDELLRIAREELKDDPGMALYDSGARGTFDNNYKNIYVTRGPVYNPVEDKFEILQGSFLDGMTKEEIPSYGTQVINGAYPKAIGTAIAGHKTKQYFAGYQDIVLDEPGSDCGSKAYREIVLDKNSIKFNMYRYILEGDKLVLITSKNKAKYIGKRVKMRSPLYCTGDKLCSKCAGELFYKLNIINIGLATSSIGSGFLNLMMKSFHDTTIRITDIDLNKMIL